MKKVSTAAAKQIRNFPEQKLTASPAAGFYNSFNFANFDLPGNALNGLLTGAAGQINGTTRAGHDVNLVGIGNRRLLTLCSAATGVRAAAHLLGSTVPFVVDFR